MELYFLRHGRSVSRSQWTGDDDERPLTDDGKTAMVHEAATLTRLGVRPDVIVTSPLTRARETAEIAATGLGAADRVEADERLARSFGPKQLRKVLHDHEEAGSIMLVGHEPDISETIGKLTGGRVVCSKGALARVDLDDGDDDRGELVWLLQADQLVGGELVPAADAAAERHAGAEEHAGAGERGTDEQPTGEAGEETAAEKHPTVIAPSGEEVPILEPPTPQRRPRDGRGGKKSRAA